VQNNNQNQQIKTIKRCCKLYICNKVTHSCRLKKSRCQKFKMAQPKQDHHVIKKLKKKCCKCKKCNKKKTKKLPKRKSTVPFFNVVVKTKNN